MSPKLVSCKFCGKEVDVKSKTCSHCGESNPVPIHKGLLGCLGIIIVAVIMIVVISITSEDKSVTIEITSEDKSVTIERLTVTNGQIDEIEKIWGGILSVRQKQIVEAFNRFKPNNYQGFAQYKVKKWLPTISKNQTTMDSYWRKFGNLEPRFDKIRKIVVAVTDLNILSISMQRYLKDQKEADLKFVNEKLFEISKISSQYIKYQPKPTDLRT